MEIKKTRKREKIVARHYAETFGSDELLTSIHYVDKNWMEEEYSGGCYASHFPAGVLAKFGEAMFGEAKFGEALRQPFKKIYFAGTELANYWASKMEGAIQAGKRAARDVLHADGKLAVSDIRQDEPMSPDFREVELNDERLWEDLPTVPMVIALAAGVLVFSCVCRAFQMVASCLDQFISTKHRKHI